MGTPQPKQGQNIDGTLKAAYPTPGNDKSLEAQLAYNVNDYIQTVYGTPPPENSNPDQMLVSETVIDWQLVHRLYVQDRANEDAYNASISYGNEASDFPTFTRDYVVRRYLYAAKTKLTPLVGIVTATVTNGGSGYTVASVVLTGGSGSGASITAIISNGVITNLAIATVGNYTTAPALSIVGDGSGATAVCAVQPQTALLTKEDAIRQPDNKLDGLYIFVRRIYDTLPGPVISGSKIDDEQGIVVDYTKQTVAQGTVTPGIIGSQVVQLVIIDGGTGFTSAPTLSISGGGGSGATATATVDTSTAGQISAITLTASGAGYTSVPTVTITDGGSGAAATAHAVLVGTTVVSLLLTAGGVSYTSPPNVVISDAGTGTGATGTTLLTGTTVSTLSPQAMGTGYTMATVAFTGGGGTGAAATANIVGTAITSYSMTNNGSGYTSIPTVTITGDGTGATATANLLATSVGTITLTASGSQYQNPSVTFSGGGGSGAAATAMLQATAVGSIVVDTTGSNYTSPAVAITGGGGGGATGTAVLASGFINAVLITNAGTNYTSSPTVGISGGGGNGAVITAVIGGLVFVDYEPTTAVKGIKMTQSVRLSTLPTVKKFSKSFRVTKRDVGAATIVWAYDDNYAAGMAEYFLRGGEGPVIADYYERWMTESAFESYVSQFLLSTTGQSISYTLLDVGIYQNVAYAYTFRPSPTGLGTSAGLVDMNFERWRLKIIKVMETVIRRSV